MEDALIQQAQEGDREAFRRLVDAYSDVVWRTTRIFVADASQAEDVAQDAWLDVWLHLTQFHRGRAFRPWLLAIVANRCRKAYRRSTPQTVPLGEDDAQHLATLDGHGDVADDVLRDEQAREIQALLAALPPRQRQVLTLHYFADLTLAEIAVVLDVPQGTVKTWLHRALASARTHLRGAYAYTITQEHDR